MADYSQYTRDELINLLRVHAERVLALVQELERREADTEQSCATATSEKQHVRG